MPTVRDVTFDVLRKLGLTTVVGNPGSTEETFLSGFPEDFEYVLALQESSVVGIADGLSQGLKAPVLVNLHTTAGMANAMGCIVTAYQNKTPLIITAGQQTRRMLLHEPFLTNVDAETMPKPWVKWSHEPRRAQDVPGAFVRAYATAVQQPSGPVFLSLPLDDWDQEMDEPVVFRTTSRRVAPDPARLAEFAGRINRSRNPALIYGADISRAGAWDEGVAFAELLGAPVWLAPFCERVSFPEDHALFSGILPPAIGPLGKALAGHDLVVVVGAPVFRYYPWVPGEYLPEDAELLQITEDPYEAAKAVTGDSLVSDAGLALADLCRLVARREGGAGAAARKPAPEMPPGVIYPMPARKLFEVLSRHVPDEYVIVDESPSNMAELGSTKLGTIRKPDSWYMMASGGLGWGMPAAVGLAMAERRTGRNRPVIAIMGDGSFQYSPQAIWTAVRHGLHVVFVVLRNEQYGILKSFALLGETPDVPGLDLPGLDIISLGRGYGARPCRVETIEEVEACFTRAIAEKGVSVLEVPIDKTVRRLLGD